MSIDKLKAAINGLHPISMEYNEKKRDGHPLVLHRKVRGDGEYVLYLEFLQIQGGESYPKKLIVDKIENLEVDFDSNFQPLLTNRLDHCGDCLAVALPSDPDSK